MGKDTSDDNSVSTPREPLADPHRFAHIYLRSCGLKHQRLRCWRGELWRWNGRCYKVVVPDDVRAELTRIVKHTFDQDRARIGAATDEPVEFKGKVTRSLISDVLQALQSLTLVSAEIDQPAWLGNSPVPGAGYL